MSEDIVQTDLELIELKKETKLDETYEMLGPIGSGGMGSVSKAKHRILGHLVAIKRIAETKTTDSNALRRFVNEAKAASRLKHENLVSVRDFGIDEAGIPYAIMDYAEGRPLSDLIENGESKDPARTINIIIEIAKGLEHAHKLGVVHRDIKPSNVIIKSNHETGVDKAVIVDFGLAKIDDHTGQKLTQTGEVYGSPYYLSPEQAIGTPVDLRSDIYSLGCVIFECIAGVPPFVGENAMQTAMKHIQVEPPLLSKASSKPLPPGLETIVSTCLQKDPADRYQTAEELLTALYAVQKGQKVKARPKQRKPLVKNKIFWVLNVVFVSIGSLAFAILPSKSPPPPSSNNPNVQSISAFANSLPVSQFAKEAVDEDMNASLILFQQKQYLKSALKLTTSTDILKKELNSIQEKINTATSHDERKKFTRDYDLVKIATMENVSHIGKCFLMAEQYKESLPYFEEASAYFHSLAKERNYFIPPTAETYKDYITALEAVGNKKKAQDIRWQFEFDQNSTKK